MTVIFKPMYIPDEKRFIINLNDFAIQAINDKLILDDNLSSESNRKRLSRKEIDKQVNFIKQTFRTKKEEQLT